MNLLGPDACGSDGDGFDQCAGLDDFLCNHPGPGHCAIQGHFDSLGCGVCCRSGGILAIIDAEEVIVCWLGDDKGGEEDDEELVDGETCHFE